MNDTVITSSRKTLTEYYFVAVYTASLVRRHMTARYARFVAA